MSKYVFTNGILLNGHRDMEPQNGINIFVNGDTIEKLSTDSNFTGYKVIDLNGKYIMPGMINLHVHLPASGKPKLQNGADFKKIIDRVMSLPRPVRDTIGAVLTTSNSKTELFSGVTTVRCVGGVEYFDALARDRINAGKMTGPRLLVSNQAVAPLKGHMAGSVSIECATVDEALKAIDKISATNPDLIKLMVTGGILDAEVRGEPGVLKMTPEMIKACCDKAHGLGYKVAAHVESNAGAIAALQNGVDTIEHGAMTTDETIRLYKETGAALVTTLSPVLPFVFFDSSLTGTNEDQQYNGKLVFEGMVQSAVSCVEAGIKVGLGTDTGCPYITHYDMWRELYYYHKYCNVSTGFALHTATLVNAEIAGVGDITGSVDVGKQADLIVTEKDPLADLSALRSISMVMARGKLYTDPKVKKYSKCEKLLDEYM